MWDENSVSNAAVTVIPSQCRVTQQILRHWQSFLDLKLMFPGSCHFCTCTTHSGAKKAHDWEVDQLSDLFRTTHHTKTQHVTKNRGRHCGDIQLEVYLANTEGPVPLVLDLHIARNCFGSSSDPNLNGH